tara:strand:- start:7 stop:324 length:318 start_codon:yes stop_codon:yes gene_type:complete
MSNPKTDRQRNAIHLWFDQVAKTLNDSSIDKVVVIEALNTRGLDMQWTGESFKSDVYKPVYQKVTAQESTEEASTTDHDICYHGLVKYFGQEFGVQLPPWPSNEG